MECWDLNQIPTFCSHMTSPAFSKRDLWKLSPGEDFRLGYIFVKFSLRNDTDCLGLHSEY